MKTHTINLFKLNNTSNLNISYKLVDFDLQKFEGREDLYNKNLKTIILKISSDLRCPAAVITRNEKQYIAIPSDKHLADTKVYTVPSPVNLKTLEEIYNIECSTMNDVLYEFLNFEIKKQLTNNFNLWKVGSNYFFSKTPVNDNGQSEIDIYGGFNYKLMPLNGMDFYISLDLTYKYADKKYLPNYINSTNVISIKDRLIGAKCLYQNGNDWYSVEIVEFGKKIKEHEFTDKNTNQAHIVMDYILQRNSSCSSVSNLLKGDDLALLYKYPGRSMEPHHGATSLAKIFHNLSDNEIRNIHPKSVLPVQKKFLYCENIIKKYFKNLKFNGTNLDISTTPLQDEAKIFRIPELKYNKNKVYSVNDNSSYRIQDFAYNRKRLILENGILTQNEFDAQYILVPDDWDKEFSVSFKNDFRNQLIGLTDKFNDLDIIKYKSLENVSASIQIKEIEKALKAHNVDSGFALFILPDEKVSSKQNLKYLHDLLKRKFYPNLKFQCASSNKIKSVYKSYASEEKLVEYKVQSSSSKFFKSYLFNLALEYLLMNRKYPYALKNNLHYDIYVGLDIHDRYAGFSFLFKNAEDIYFFPIRIPKRTRGLRHEKLYANQIEPTLYEKLKYLIPICCPDPNGLVFVRDGRSFGEEEIALMQTINKLGLSNKPNFKYGVIELHKNSSIPLREAFKDYSGNLKNVKAGTHRILDEINGFIFNTGYPFNINGTVKPIHLINKFGNLDFKKVMQDLFNQSMLAFSAPDRSNSLPIIIKIIDTLLEPLSGIYDKDDVEEIEYEETETF